MGDLTEAPQVGPSINRSYFQTGLYSRWLEMYFAEVGRASVFVTTFDELCSGPEITMSGIFVFLGLEAEGSTARSKRTEQTSCVHLSSCGGTRRPQGSPTPLRVGHSPKDSESTGSAQSARERSLADVLAVSRNR